MKGSQNGPLNEFWDKCLAHISGAGESTINNYKANETLVSIALH